MGSIYDNFVRQAIKRNTAFSGAFELTSRCNLRCQMCFVCDDTNQTKSRELTAAQWIDLAAQAQQNETLILLLTGGEPLIREDFWQIYEAIYKMGFLITLNTNGTTITPDVMRRLSKNPPRKVAVSVYGSSAHAYEKVCGNAAAFEKMKLGVECLLTGPFDVKLRSVITKQTVDDLPAITNLALGWKKPLNVVSYISPPRENSGMNPMESRLTAEQVLKAQTGVVESYTKYLQNNPDLHTSDEDDEEDKTDFSQLKDGHPFRCAAGRYAYWITWQGSMTPCALMEDPAVDVIKNGFKASWESLVQQCRDVPICQSCSECSLRDKCGACPARLKNETGSYEQKAPYLCERAKLADKMSKPLVYSD